LRDAFQGAIIRTVPHYRVELHSHCQGDPVDNLTHTVFEQIDQAKKVGLDAIAITWHRAICSDPAPYTYARRQGILLISGMEAEVDGKHLVVLGLDEGDLPGQPTWEEVRALRTRKPGVVVMAPHPFYPHPTCLNSHINEHPELIDAVEWCALHVHWLPNRVNPNLRAARWAHRHGKPLVACSDSHSLAAIGRNPSTVEAKDLTSPAILDAVRTGKVSFPRHSLDMGRFLLESGRAVVGQHRHIGRWMASRLRRQDTTAR
jgi:predicted metal-dependent phosphoesterase TrpH